MFEPKKFALLDTGGGAVYFMQVKNLWIALRKKFEYRRRGIKLVIRRVSKL
jgi:hypothetical protein